MNAKFYENSLTENDLWIDDGGLNVIGVNVNNQRIYRIFRFDEFRQRLVTGLSINHNSSTTLTLKLYRIIFDRINLRTTFVELFTFQSAANAGHGWNSNNLIPSTQILSSANQSVFRDYVNNNSKFIVLGKDESLGIGLDTTFGDPTLLEPFGIPSFSTRFLRIHSSYKLDISSNIPKLSRILTGCRSFNYTTYNASLNWKTNYLGYIINPSLINSDEYFIIRALSVTTILDSSEPYYFITDEGLSFQTSTVSNQHVNILSQFSFCEIDSYGNSKFSMGNPLINGSLDYGNPPLNGLAIHQRFRDTEPPLRNTQTFVFNYEIEVYKII